MYLVRRYAEESNNDRTIILTHYYIPAQIRRNNQGLAFRKKLDLNGKDTILMPYHINENHWISLNVDLKLNTITVYDSIYNSEILSVYHQIRNDITEYINWEKTAREQDNIEMFELIIDHNFIQQQDSLSCGLWTLANIKAILIQDNRLHIIPKRGTELRKLIHLELASN